MKGWREEEDKMLKYRRKDRIALVVEFRVSFWMWRCAGRRNDGEFVEAVEVEDGNSKIKYIS